jgi:hypothetical protein
VRGAVKLAATLAAARELATLFLDLATLRTNALVGKVDDWEWRGPNPEFAAVTTRLGVEQLAKRANALTERRSA